MLQILFPYSHMHFITSILLFLIMAFSGFWPYCSFLMDGVFFAKSKQLFTYNKYWLDVSPVWSGLWHKWEFYLNFICLPINRMKAWSKNEPVKIMRFILCGFFCCCHSAWSVPSFLSNVANVHYAQLVHPSVPLHGAMEYADFWLVCQLLDFIVCYQ